MTEEAHSAPAPGADAAPDGDPSQSYAEAIAELDQILREIEDETLDVDVLATRVKRAAELVRFCRGRIRNATREVEHVVAALDETDPSTASAGPDAAPTD